MLPKIVKLVPVRKNGFILELQVPPPGESNAAVPNLASVRQNYEVPPAELPVQAANQPEAVVTAGQNFDLRNFFKR